MGIWEIITIGLAVIASPIIVTFVWHILARERDRMEKFSNAGEEFGNIFTQALVEIQGDGYVFTVLNHQKVPPSHLVASLNFRRHLRGEYLKQYDCIWDQYCHHFETFGEYGTRTRVTRMDIKKDIEALLELTEYRLSRSAIFFWKRILNELRWRLCGPDDETKEIAEKFIKAYQEKSHPPSDHK